MKILFNNVDFSSNSGPNNFGKKIATQLFRLGHEINVPNPEIAINFIQGYMPGIKNVLRLDGIYFNSSQDWKSLNDPIKKSYDLADAVIVQSNFNKDLVFKYFGERNNVSVIHNGTFIDELSEIPNFDSGYDREKVWFCASSWRPHKRLDENIRYFLENSNKDDVLFIAGANAHQYMQQNLDARIKYLGDLTWHQMISVMKSSKNFLHLALLDHCPNVVVDANACGCHIICASSGGTNEIVGKNSTIVQDIDWNFLPFELYNPPKLNFSIKKVGNYINLDIKDCAKSYEKVLRDCLNEFK